ncbi:hypothetical protein B0H10DRAFT_1950408 [Mycena sp. CBHHK59/15]|nr:hypothetical protein B0H10DRAFT_1950408 [Mycena sp. CBHHK59/15]
MTVIPSHLIARRNLVCQTARKVSADFHGHYIHNAYLFLEQDDDMVSDHEVKYKGERGKGKAFEPEPRFREANGKEKAHDSEVSSGAEGHFDGTDGLDPDEIHGDRKGKGKAKVSQWSHSFEFFEAKPVSSEHLQVHRLLKNMTKSKNTTWSDEESDAGEDDLEQWEQQPLPINHL